MSYGLNEYDHELYIGSTTYGLMLHRDADGKAMYRIDEFIPQYRDPLRHIQSSWVGGHGQYVVGDRVRYFEGQSIDTTIDGRICLGPLITTVQESDDTDLDSAPVQFVWFKSTGEWLCATAGKIYRYNVGANLKWTAATTTVAGVTHLCEFNGIMYAAVGSSTLYWYSADGITWTQTDLTDGYAIKFMASPNPDGTADNLWKIKTPNELSRTTDGRTVAGGGIQWESPTFIGDTSHNVINLFLQNNRLMVGKEDNLFHVDSNGGVHPYRDDLKTNYSTNNFKYVAEWQTSVYHSENRGMAEISSYNTYDRMGPLHDIPDINKVGDVVGLASDENWLYVGMDEGTNTHIYKGRETVVEDRLVWQWCPWVFLSTTTTAAMNVCRHSNTDIRLWFGYGNATAYVIITDNPTANSAARFAATGWLRMSYDYGTNPEWDMLWQSVVTETKGCNATGEDVVIKYRKDTDTSATACTGDIVTNGIVETNLSAQVAAKRIQFEIHLSSDTNTATPEVLYFEVKGKEVPVSIRTHVAIYKVKSDATDTTKTTRDALRTARASTALLKFADLRFEQSTRTGTGYVWVLMEPGYPREVELVHTKGQEPELGVECKLTEVSYTIS